MQKTILSGTTATGQLHLGNYLGALKPWVDMSNKMNDAVSLFFVADLHGITVPHNKDKLAAITRESAAAYIASGLDINKVILFAQSSVYQHPYLHWMLGSIAQMGQLKRMTQYKEKSNKVKDGASLNLFSYPVLQAADILMYKSTHVPVGEDQKQHVEFARDVAGGFNHLYGDVFPLPEPVIQAEGARIMSLRDGTSKMSKSAESDMSRINLVDDADMIAQKFRKAKSDSDALPTSDAECAGRPEAKNLMTIYSILSDVPMTEVYNQFGGKMFSELKSSLSDLAVEKMAPITAEMNRLLAHPDEIDKILKNGAERASEIAAPVLEEVKDKMGFISL